MISGGSGVGKSAIAGSLVSVLSMQGRLASHFFFKRGHVNVGDPSALWRTEAFDLIHFHPDLMKSVIGYSEGVDVRGPNITYPR
jgi:hypothetical protein